MEENEDIKVIFPIHKNPRIRELAKEYLDQAERIRIIEPLDVLAFHNYMARSYLILTDSGGVQEEAPSLGVPVLVLRDVTERPVGVEAGVLEVVGTDEDTVYQSVIRLLTDKEKYQAMSRSVNPYGDGNASLRIANVITGLEWRR